VSPHLAEFSPTVGGLMMLRDWLAAHRVTHVAIEATGVYWQPAWHVLEDDFELTLCNARHVRQVPGRKTDISDAQWLCQLMEASLLRGSFVPPKPQRELRTLTRYRKTQIAERQREASRLHKALEDTGIKLDCVASDILGKSGRAMLDALVAGTTDPEILAELAKGRLRAKLPALKEALQGRFEAHHALVIGAILSHLDFLDGQISHLSDAIEERLGPFAAGVELASSLTASRDAPPRSWSLRSALIWPPSRLPGTSRAGPEDAPATRTPISPRNTNGYVPGSGTAARWTR
jgi:transposase